MIMSKYLLAAHKLAAHTNKLQHKTCVKLWYPTHKRQRVQRETNAHVIHCELQEKRTKMRRTELTGQLAKWNFLKHLNTNKNNSLLYEAQYTTKLTIKWKSILVTVKVGFSLCNTKTYLEGQQTDWYLLCGCQNFFVQIWSLLIPVFISILVVEPHQYCLVHSHGLDINQWSLQGYQHNFLVLPLNHFILECISQTW